MTPKRFHEIVQSFAKRKVEGCKECGGSGRRWKCQPACHAVGSIASCIDCGLQSPIPCPSCAPCRALLEEFKCWHEDRITGISPKYQAYTCYSCGKQTNNRKANPTFATVESIKSVLVKAGEFKGFREWLYNKYYNEEDEILDRMLALTKMIDIVSTPDP